MLFGGTAIAWVGAFGLTLWHPLHLSLDFGLALSPASLLMASHCFGISTYDRFNDLVKGDTN